MIDEIQARQDERGLVKTHTGPSFKPGDAVRVLRGALGEFEALFESSDDRDRVTVLLSILGRQVRARVEKDAVFAAV